MKYLGIFAAIIVVLLVLHNQAYGLTSSSVTATIKLSICGNLVAEGGEDCDNTDLKGKSCVSLGYGGGVLSCDISCSYDTTGCIAATPTPNPTASETSESQSASTPTPTSTPVPSLPQSVFTPTPQRVSFFPNLPTLIKNFANSQTGKIAVSQLKAALTVWVNTWKQTTAKTKGATKLGVSKTSLATCDINHDGICDIRDFSIVLSYVEKK